MKFIELHEAFNSVEKAYENMQALYAILDKEGNNDNRYLAQEAMKAFSPIVQVLTKVFKDGEVLPVLEEEEKSPE